MFKILAINEKPYSFKNDNGQDVKGIAVTFCTLVTTVKEDGSTNYSTMDIKVNYNAYTEFMKNNGFHSSKDLLNKDVMLLSLADEKTKANIIQMVK